MIRKIKELENNHCINSVCSKLKPILSVITGILILILVILIPSSENEYKENITKLSNSGVLSYKYYNYKSHIEQPQYGMNRSTDNILNGYYEDGRKDYYPTIYVHGYMGTSSVYDYLLRDLKEEGIGQLELKISINKEGVLTSTYENFRSKRYLPFITLEFEDNTASLSKQTEWLSNAINEVKKRYGEDKVNIVAHSMGGVVAINYVTNSYLEGKDINKLVTMDSPILGADTLFFKGLESGVNVLGNIGGVVNDVKVTQRIQDLLHTEAYKELTDSTLIKKAYASHQEIPKQLGVLSLYFECSEVVTKTSAFGLKYYTGDYRGSNKESNYTNISYKVIKTPSKDKLSKGYLIKNTLTQVKSSDVLNDLNFMRSTIHCDYIDSEQVIASLKDYLFREQLTLVDKYTTEAKEIKTIREKKVKE